MIERPELKLSSHERKVQKFWRSTAEIEGLLIACSLDIDDRELISPFVEGWHKETNSFHLPIGEATIILDDVALLLHLPIIGTFHSFETLHVDEVVLMLVELLEVNGDEVSGDEARVETVQCYGTYVRLSWLRKIYHNKCEAKHCTVAARCWIYEHFPSIAETFTDEDYDERSPCACHWTSTKALPVLTYRKRLDLLTMADWASDHMDWFYKISYPFMRPTQPRDPPRHPPIMQDETYVELDKPQYPVPVAAMEEAPTHAPSDVEQSRHAVLLNLKIVTKGVETYDVKQDCLRIARGVIVDRNVYVRS
ncbi:Protein MAIN-LIKE 1 [Glycine soja]